MEILWAILAIVAGFLGFAGSVLPVIPGPPLSFIGLLLLLPCEGATVSNATLWVSGIFLILVSVLDYVAPIWFTNLTGGSKQGTRGSMIGMLAGLFFFPPWGLIFGPFIGAFIGELVANSGKKKAFKVAFMSFLGFILTTGMKLIYGAVLLFIIVYQVVRLWVA